MRSGPTGTEHIIGELVDNGQTVNTNSTDRVDFPDGSDVTGEARDRTTVATVRSDNPFVSTTPSESHERSTTRQETRSARRSCTSIATSPCSTRTPNGEFDPDKITTNLDVLNLTCHDDGSS